MATKTPVKKDGTTMKKMKIRSNTRKVFNMTMVGDRQGYLLDCLDLMKQCRKRLKKKFDAIMELLEGGEYHNSRKMKEKKRSLEEFLASFGNYSTLYLEWKELLKQAAAK